MLVTVSDRDLLLPTCTLSKLKLDCVGARTAGVTLVAPIPESAMFSVGLEALLVTARLPLTVPAACGAKTTLKLGLLWPGLKVKGRLKPLMLNPAPVGVACMTVKLEPPELVSVSGSVSFKPTCTLPKPRLDCVGLRVPGLLVTPLPESETVTGLSGASLEIVRFPVTLPGALGVKLMLKVTFWPTATVRGRAGCVRENWLALKTALETATAAVPLLAAVAVNVLLVPTVTLPKSTVDPLMLKLPLVPCFEAALMP